MELRQLRYFQALADQLNYSRAAKMLYITQPTLTQQINALERSLGVLLFIRDKKTVRLTPAGEMLKKQSADLLDRADEIERALQAVDMADASEGTLRVGYTTHYAHSAIAEYLRRLKTHYPAVGISLKYIDNESLEKELVSEIDVAFSYRSKFVFLPDFDSVSLAHHRLLLLAPISYFQVHPDADYTDCFRDLDIFIVENDLRGMRNLMTLFEKLSVFPRIHYVDTHQTALLLVEAGLGTTITNNAAPFDENKYRCVEFFQANRHQNPVELELICVWNKRRANTALQKFIELIKDT